MLEILPGNAGRRFYRLVADGEQTYRSDISGKPDNALTAGTEFFLMLLPSRHTTLPQRENRVSKGGIEMKPTFFALILIDDQGAERFGGAFNDPSLAVKKGESIGKRFEVRPAFL